MVVALDTTNTGMSRIIGDRGVEAVAGMGGSGGRRPCVDVEVGA